jgi:hypothetical protein
MSTQETTLKSRAARMGLVLRIDTHDGKHRARLTNDAGEVEILALHRHELLAALIERLS